MNNIEQKIKKELKIETIRNIEGSEASCCGERGGIFTSIKFKGKEILYLDEETFQNKELSVKGGVPNLFPNAGPIPEEMKTDDLKNLKQHGFARNLIWKVQKGLNNIRETLASTKETKEIYPYDFELIIDGCFEDNGSFTISQFVKNLEKEKEMPISSGLHPYFKVPDEEKKNIKFNFEGGKEVEEQIGKWEKGEAVSIPNPGVPIEVTIPGTGTLVFNISKEYERIWIWSMEGKDFICVEPVMRDVGSIVSDPVKIKPEETHSSSFNIYLKEEKNENQN